MTRGFPVSGFGEIVHCPNRIYLPNLDEQLNHP